jgi:hypothetical protein
MDKKPTTKTGRKAEKGCLFHPDRVAGKNGLCYECAMRDQDRQLDNPYNKKAK